MEIIVNILCFYYTKKVIFAIFKHEHNTISSTMTCPTADIKLFYSYIINIRIYHNSFSGHFRECEAINRADEEDTLYRVATPSVSKGGKGKDFILLASRRKPCDSRYCAVLHTTPHSHHGTFVLNQSFYVTFKMCFSIKLHVSFIPVRDPYLIALRSVTLPTHPPTEDYTRGEVLCAGFTIREEFSNVTKVGEMRGSRGS